MTYTLSLMKKAWSVWTFWETEDKGKGITKPIQNDGARIIMTIESATCCGCKKDQKIANLI